MCSRYKLIGYFFCILVERVYTAVSLALYMMHINDGFDVDLVLNCTDILEL